MKAQTMQKLRRYHYYLGVFFAPVIIMFALSGALQTFRLQEEKGWGSEPPAWIVWMGSIHRDSKLPKAKPSEAEHTEAAKPAVAPAPTAQPEAAKPKPPQVNKLPMQIFMVVMSVALLLSSFLGIAIALNSKATRQAALVMLALGTLVPLAVLYTA
ncbi:MAG: hypothetical protein ACOYKQ_03240 [Polymorphobacter sp.]